MISQNVGIILFITITTGLLTYLDSLLGMGGPLLSVTVEVGSDYVGSRSPRALPIVHNHLRRAVETALVSSEYLQVVSVYDSPFLPFPIPSTFGRHESQYCVGWCRRFPSFHQWTALSCHPTRPRPEQLSIIPYSLAYIAKIITIALLR